MGMTLGADAGSYLAEILGSEAEAISLLQKLSTYCSESFLAVFDNYKVIEFYNGKKCKLTAEDVELELGDSVKNYMSYSFDQLENTDWAALMPTIIFPGLDSEWQMSKIEADPTFAKLYSIDHFKMSTRSKFDRFFDTETFNFIDDLDADRLLVVFR